jgi:hypothetical protein
MVLIFTRRGKNQQLSSDQGPTGKGRKLASGEGFWVQVPDKRQIKGKVVSKRSRKGW